MVRGGVPFIRPEQRHVDFRDPSILPRLPGSRLPDVPQPPTVANPQSAISSRRLSLDEAIRIALENANVIRVFAGASAVSSGRTIYDPPITNTQIDEELARFDPEVEATNLFNRFESPFAIFDPFDPSRALITGTTTTDFDMGLGLSKTSILGGTSRLGITANPTRTRTNLLPLNPRTPHSIDLSFAQPLLQGAGRRVNLVPIMVARIDTQRSFFQLKDSVQELVRGVIEAYWSLVFARTDVWARQQQVDQGMEALGRAEANLKFGLGDLGSVAQARSSLGNFRANLIASRANVLQQEAALLNILGLPPSGGDRFVPVTPPSIDRLEISWEDTIRLADEQRPDLIELKLIIEADQQLLLQSRNQALPRVDATMLYRWNGLEGRMPDLTRISTSGGEFADWTLGVNFSVPLGLRQARAQLRQQQLIIARDRVNLEQGLHAAIHILAANLRNLAQSYEQYLAFRETRVAARISLERQLADYTAGRETLYLNVLLAITDWGNAVSSEARSLTQYNTELANLERQTGTILETHGVRFYEERYRSIGPLGRLFPYPLYARDLRPTPNAGVYPSSDEPAENVFDLDTPVPPRRDSSPPLRPPSVPIEPESIPPPLSRFDSGYLPRVQRSTRTASRPVIRSQ